MDHFQDNETTTQKIYKEKAIWVGTFLGGPLVAGYLISENFKVFDQQEKARKAWIYSIIVTAIVFGGVFLIPDNVKVPNQIIPLIYTFIAYQFVQIYQKAKITTHINAGGQVYSWWRTIGVALIGLLITVIIVFSIAMLVIL
jgi:ABC-type phosphate/phosphonate transport system permease subunit